MDNKQQQQKFLTKKNAKIQCENQFDRMNEWIIMEQTDTQYSNENAIQLCVWQQQQQQRRQSLIDPKKENWYSQVPFIHSFDGIYY